MNTLKKVSTEELINELDNLKDIPDKIILDEVFQAELDTFIEIAQIKRGEERTQLKNIYRCFSNWSTNKIQYKKFVEYFSANFDTEVNDKKFIVALIDKKSYEIFFNISQYLKDKKKTDRINVRKNKKLFDLFVESNGIKKGNTLKVHLDLLYFVFTKWVKKNRKNVVNKNIFKKYIEFYIKIDKDMKYSINKNMQKFYTNELLETYKKFKLSKKKRNRNKYPALKVEYNLKSRKDLIDYDYVSRLTEKEKNWLNRFTEEYVNANFNHSGKLIVKDKKTKKNFYKMNNDRNADIFTRTKTTGELIYSSDSYKTLEKSSDHIEDDLIDLLDSKKLNNFDKSGT